MPAQGWDWLLAAVCAPLGARVAAHQRRNPCGWLLLAVGGLSALTVAASIAPAGPVAWLRGWVWWPVYGLLVLVVLLFPDGRATGRVWRAVVAAVVGAIAAGTVALASLALRVPELLTGRGQATGGWDRALFLAATVAVFLGGLLAVPAAIVRIGRTPAGRRGPLLWAAGNAALFIVAVVLDAVASVPDVWLAGALAIPVATAVGVVRYGLYDIGLLAHRSLLYGVLTAAGIALYSGTAALAAWLLPPAGAPVAVATTAVVLLPLRQGLQALLRRTLYGLGARPHELVSTIGRHAAGAATPELTLAGAVTALGTGLRLPYAAVPPDASYGQRRPWPVTELPLTHRGAPVGSLIVQQRAPDEPWTRSERRLLDDLCAQFGAVAAAVRLAHELRAAREETGRLRRDLHDGIGPALSGARMLVRSGRLRAGDPAVAHTLDELDEGLAEAAAEIRRILDNLRPAALDRGLAFSLDAAARRHGSAVVRLHGDLDLLPEAVQVTAYRIVDEALTNVAKHAAASVATVTVHRGPESLRVEILDDGVGGAVDRPGGIGLASMRQRCEDLGGSLDLLPATPGTRVVATLPLP